MIEEVEARDIKALLLTDCCDVCRRIYDVLKHSDRMDFLFLMALPHKCGEAEVELLTSELERLKSELESFMKTQSFYAEFSEDLAIKALAKNALAAGEMEIDGPHISLSGAHGGSVLKKLLSDRLPLPVQDDTCSGRRVLSYDGGIEWDLRNYAKALLTQERPCMRMQFEDESPSDESVGTVFHSMKFCDYYSFKYKDLRTQDIKLLKIETDSTPQSSGQLRTRIDAFAESLGIAKQMENNIKVKYVAGVDSGSASTDAVIMDSEKNILGSAILPTGSGASKQIGRAHV